MDVSNTLGSYFRVVGTSNNIWIIELSMGEASLTVWQLDQWYSMDQNVGLLERIIAERWEFRKRECFDIWVGIPWGIEFEIKI